MTMNQVSRVVLAASLGFLLGTFLSHDSVESLQKSNKNMFRLYMADHKAIGECRKYATLIRALEVSRLKLSPMDQIRLSKDLPFNEGGEE